jgi:phosphatidylglycerophosphate synthase
MEQNRRPIKTRSHGWAKALSTWCVTKGISPNQISVASVWFAMVGAGALMMFPALVGPIICLVCIQMRLVCNLIDGMVAIEGGQKSAVGSLYNEFPDRIADSLFLVALGYAAGFGQIGWFAALAAALTAYVRVFGGSLGLPQSFMGPMAKQHRMAVMTLGLALHCVESALYGTHNVLVITVVTIVIGSLMTCGTRTMAINQALKEKAHADK